MIYALWQWLTTPVTPLARRHGFLTEAIGLYARFQRCRAPWRRHYAQCAAQITQAMDQAQQHRVCVILGAGLLEDMPLAEVSARFDQVWLVDMVFLRQARRKARAFANVRLLERDITGCLAQLSQHSAVDPQAVETDSPLGDWLAQVKADCVISLNLLTQLPLPMVAWWQARGVDAHRLNALAQQLIKAHCQGLIDSQLAGGVVCLITDQSIDEYSAQGEKIDQIDPLWGLDVRALLTERLPTSDIEGLQTTTWPWEAVPLSESGQDRVTRVHQVTAFRWARYAAMGC